MIRGLHKEFAVRGRVFSALSAVDIEIRQREFVAIVGPSGCGKTTLLRILAGLEAPSGGTIELRPDGDARRPATAMVFQEQSVFPWLTVRDNIAFGLKARGIDKKTRRAMADRHVAMVHLDGFADALPHQLSGGMKQRVALARAFANDPEMLLMDEPFGALDEQTKLVLQTELLRIWESSRQTVVYVTHSIDEAILLADRVLVMSARPGRIVDDIDVTAAFDRPRLVESVRSDPHYGELFRRIWGHLRTDQEPGGAPGPHL